jgi:glycosyltransferase involved in cell wall biosynthesis
MLGVRVALNATCLNDRPSGAKQRFLGIYRALSRRMPDTEFVIFEPADCRMAGWFEGLPNVKTQSTPIPSLGRWRKLYFSARFWDHALRHEAFNLFEGFHLPLPAVPGSKTILTVHDIRRLHADCSWLDRIAFRHALNRGISNADMVVTVSEAMKVEILPYCGQTPVCVIPNGIDPAVMDVSPSHLELEAFCDKLALPDHFLLTVGHLERRKNYPNLVDAIAILRDSGLSLHLLIVGNDSGERSALEDQIEAKGLQGRITIANGLTDTEVRCAYALCELFVFPSTYEGFGIPILEAMAAGRSMVLADIPVFREITGGRGVFFSPFDPKEIAFAIQKGLLRKVDQARLVDWGFKRLKDYEYSAIAVQYEALYRNLLASA